MSIEQSCPLCGLAASCIEVAGDGGNLIDVECGRCTRYVISRWAIRCLTVEYALMRELLVSVVRETPAGKRLLIDKRPADEDGDLLRTQFIDIEAIF
jgi:hypothetical protein